MIDVTKMTDKEISDRLKHGKSILTFNQYNEEKILLKTEQAKRKKATMEGKLRSLYGKCVMAEVLLNGHWVQMKTYIIPNTMKVHMVYGGMSSKYPRSIDASVYGIYLYENNGTLEYGKSYVNAKTIKFRRMLPMNDNEKCIIEQFLQNNNIEIN